MVQVTGPANRTTPTSRLGPASARRVREYIASVTFELAAMARAADEHAVAETLDHVTSAAAAGRGDEAAHR